MLEDVRRSVSTDVRVREIAGMSMGVRTGVSVMQF